jgi:hypothetical protein
VEKLDLRLKARLRVETEYDGAMLLCLRSLAAVWVKVAGRRRSIKDVVDEGR